jgi:hypothetical protein
VRHQPDELDPRGGHFSRANSGIDAAAPVTILPDEEGVSARQDLELALAFRPSGTAVSRQGHQHAEKRLVLLVHHGHFQLALAVRKGDRLLGLATQRDTEPYYAEENSRQHSSPDHHASQQQED